MKELNKILVNNSATIKEAMRVIDRGAIKTAIVVDKSNKLCGMVTDGDIRRGILRGVYANVNSTKDDILNIIKKKKSVLNLPLVDENKVVKDFVVVSKGTEISYFNKGLIVKNHIKKILVIGGAGYIGSVLVRKLLNKGYEVNVLDNFTYGKKSLEGIKLNPKLKIIEGDMLMQLFI